MVCYSVAIDSPIQAPLVIWRYLILLRNHEYMFNHLTPEEIQTKYLTNCIYLQDSSVTLFGIKFYGTPWNGITRHWWCIWSSLGSQNMSFGCRKRMEKWQLIPTDTEVNLHSYYQLLQWHCLRLYCRSIHIADQPSIGLSFLWLTTLFVFVVYRDNDF
jgi:hypothetical protein